MSENEVIILSSDEENDAAGQTVTSSTSSKRKGTSDSKTVKRPVKRIDCVVNLDIVLTNRSKRGSYSASKLPKKPRLNTSVIEVIDLGGDDFTESSDSSKILQTNNSANEMKESTSKPQVLQTTVKTKNATNQERNNNVDDLENDSNDDDLENDSNDDDLEKDSNDDDFENDSNDDDFENDSNDDDLEKDSNDDDFEKDSNDDFENDTNDDDLEKDSNDDDLEKDSNVDDLEKDNNDELKEDVLPSTSSNNDDYFNEFINLCAEIEDDEDDKKKMIKKLRKKYNKAEVKYVKSKEFKNLIESSIKKLCKNNLYIIVREISSELRFNKKPKTKKSNSSGEKENRQVNPENDEIRKKLSLIKRIKRVLKELAKKIKELEVEEVDLDDEESSSFIKLHEYRTRFFNIYDRLCIMTNKKWDNEKIRFTESKYPVINKCIENWLNETKRFPDFSDILNLLETHRSALGVPSPKESLREIAVDIFQKVGLMLKRRRCFEFWDGFSSILENTVDPSLESPELSEKLKKNFNEGLKKQQEIINFYAEKQEEERLKRKQSLDEEAEKSSLESESEEVDEIEKFVDETINKKIETPLNKIGESKNNFKNCKSLKWRGEKNSPNNNNNNKNNNNNDNSNCIEKPNVDNCVGKEHNKQIKRNFKFANKLEPRKKVSLTPIITKVESLQREDSCAKNQEKIEVYDLYSCQVEPQYDAFYKLDFIDEFFKSKEDFKKKKFRNFTNVGNLMKIDGKRKDYPVLFSRSIFHNRLSWESRRNVDINKFSNFKVQKCGSNQEEKSEKNVGRSSGNSKGKDYSDSDNKEEESAYFSGSGNDEENNNGDENKKNVKIDNDEEENQNEDDEEEENETEENLHSKTNISHPKMEATVSDAIEVKTEDVNSSLTQVKSETIDVKEIENIKIEHHIKVEPKKEDLNENEVLDKVKEETTEKTNNDEVNGNKKVSSDYVAEDKTKSVGVKKSENEVKDTKKVNETSDSKDCSVVMDDEDEAIFIEQLNPIVEINTFKTPSIPRSSCESKQPSTQSYVESQKLYEVETIVQRMRQHNSNQSPSDEERVKRFLLNSPSSISITPPKKFQCKNPLSQEALQALETLKNLKGISATRVVREKPESEDDVIVIGESSAKTRRPNPRYQLPPKQRRLDQTSTDTHTSRPSQPRQPAPQVTQNQHLFNNCNNQSNGEKSHGSTSIKISNVWGALSLKVYESISTNNNNLVAALDSSSRQRRSKSSISGNLAAARKKKPNQPVEYVVLD